MSRITTSLLRRAAPLAELPENVLARLAEALVEREYAAGAVVVREGGRGDELFVIADRRAEVSAEGPRGATVRQCALIVEVRCRRALRRLAALDPSPAGRRGLEAIVAQNSFGATRPPPGA